MGRLLIHDIWFTEDGKRTPVKVRPESLQVPKMEKEPGAKVEGNVVQVPDMDDAAEFFAPQSTQEEIEVTSEDFDHLFVYSADM